MKSKFAYCFSFILLLAVSGFTNAEIVQNFVVVDGEYFQSVKRIMEPLKQFVVLSSESRKGDDGKNIIRFPPGKNIIISDNPLSKNILDSFSKLIIVTVTFHQDKKVFTYAGSGFPIRTDSSFSIRKGLVATALHLILPSENDLIQAGFNMNSQMTITIGGQFCTPTHTVSVPLTKVGQGSKALEDILILKADISEIQKMFDNLGDNVASAEKLSLLLFIQALKEGISVSDKMKLEEKNKSFVSGFFSLFGNVVPYIFEDQLTMELSTSRIPDSGVDRIYCFRGGIEPGFSGGPIFNDEGEVVALSIGSSLGRNFVVAIPIKEVMEVAKSATEQEKEKE